jgi:multimeric flavodoxin WrbA
MVKPTVYLLGVSGSPNEGSTAFAVKKALSYAHEKFDAKTDYFSVRGKTINYCLHCDCCIRERKGCVQKDDMTLAYEKLERADALIIGTPVYQGSVSGQVKVFLDRCRAIVAKDPNVFKDKVGAGIAVGGDRVGGQELALQTIHAFYLINKIIPVGGGPFGANLGGTVWSKDLGMLGAKEDSEGMKTIQKTVKRLLETAMKLKGLESEK